MRMFGERIATETPELDAEGRADALRRPPRGGAAGAGRAMEWAEEKTAGNDRIVFFVAFNYGGRAEIVDAARSFQGELRGGVPPPPLRARDARPRPPDHEPAASAASPTTCSGSAPTRSWSSATSSGPTSTAPPSRQSLREYETRQRRFGARSMTVGPLRRRDVRGRSRRRRRGRRGSRGASAGSAARRRSGSSSALPWIVFAIAIVVAGGLVFAAAMIAIGVALPARVPGDDRGLAAAADPRLRRRRGAGRRRPLRHRLQRADDPRRLLPAALLLRRPSRSTATGSRSRSG